ncbi:hypothetical protein FB567DRAFT_266222 [Paraphoma chrysanthemicola]|uniref:Secreted protein n=1 Tax=Paraphoma chrysanthemicola TaxID=798071 RepID=A0A8K0W112_9PLEO|nr:hypothetical protein FB567DRAFT_266222 [Paraphoma chrysanthemicola]
MSQIGLLCLYNHVCCMLLTSAALPCVPECLARCTLWVRAETLQPKAKKIAIPAYSTQAEQVEIEAMRKKPTEIQQPILPSQSLQI